MLLFVGFFLAVGTAWVLPNIGFRSEYSVKNRRGLLQPGDTIVIRMVTRTSTTVGYTCAFDGGKEAPPNLPDNPSTFLSKLDALPFEPGIAGPLIHPAPTYVFPSAASWSAELRGFPFRCLWSWHADTKFLNPSNLPRSSALEIPGFATGPGVIGYSLPITPLWTGLAANTVFWAAVVACIPWAVRRIRLEIRHRIEQSRIDRGLCPTCLYPREPLVDRCPECGRQT